MWNSIKRFYIIIFICIIVFNNSTMFIYGSVINKIGTDNLIFERKKSNIEHCNLNSITYNKGLFVAVGEGGVIYKSVNGDDWDSQYVDKAYDLSQVISNDKNFVAIGHRGAYNYNYDRRHLVEGGY